MIRNTYEYAALSYIAIEKAKGKREIARGKRKKQ